MARRVGLCPCEVSSFFKASEKTLFVAKSAIRLRERVPSCNAVPRRGDLRVGECAYLPGAHANRTARHQKQTADELRVPRICGGRWPSLLRRELRDHVPA